MNITYEYASSKMKEIIPDTNDDLAVGMIISIASTKMDLFNSTALRIIALGHEDSARQLGRIPVDNRVPFREGEMEYISASYSSVMVHILASLYTVIAQARSDTLMDIVKNVVVMLYEIGFNVAIEYQDKTQINNVEHEENLLSEDVVLSDEMQDFLNSLFGGQDE